MGITVLYAEKTFQIIPGMLRVKNINDHGEKQVRFLSYLILKIFSRSTTNSNAIFFNKNKKRRNELLK